MRSDPINRAKKWSKASVIAQAAPLQSNSTRSNDDSGLEETRPCHSPNFRSLLTVISIKGSTRSILISMGLDHVLLDFFARAAAGAASVLMVIFLVGISIPRRSAAVIRRNRR